MNYKTMLLPILSTVAILIQLVFGIQIPEEVLDQTATAVANLILVGITVYGIFKNHKDN